MYDLNINSKFHSDNNEESNFRMANMKYMLNLCEKQIEP